MSVIRVSSRQIGQTFLACCFLAVAPPPMEAAWRVNLTILQYQQIDAPDDRLGGEFYPKVTIGNHRFRSPGHREDTMRDAPHWTFRYSVSDDRPIPIRIGMWDQDWPDADDHLDVSPTDGRRDLQITFDPQSGAIRGDVSGSAGQDIVVDGRGEDDRVRIVFRITHEHVTPPARAAGDSSALIPVAQNRCQPRANGRYGSNGSEERWQGGLYAASCDAVLDITGVDASQAFAGGHISLSSINFAFGTRRDDQVVGLLRMIEGRIYAVRLLPVVHWSSGQIVAQVHDGVPPGQYGLAVLNRLPQSDGSALGVFELGSDTMSVTVR